MSLVSRVQNILMSPQTEWPVIAAEGASVGSLYTGYIIPLAAIGPVCSIIGSGILGPLGLVGGIIAAIVTYALTLVMTYVMAFIASKLAPSFGGRDDLTQGLKLIAYSYTAPWVVGIFLLIPGSIGRIFGILGLYSLYLLYLGASPVVGVPQDRSVIYIIVLIVVAVVLTMIVGLITGLLLGGMLMATMH
jgi:hypothetical protein